MNIDGSGVTRLTNNDADDAFPTFSPDGGTIAFHSFRDGDWGIYILNVDGSGEKKLTEGNWPRFPAPAQQNQR